MGWDRERPRKPEPASTAKFGSSDRLDPGVLGRADRVAVSARGGNGVQNAPAPAPSTYGDFATSHPPLFTEPEEPLEADHWLWVMEFKFGLLRCTEVQKTLFAAHQLHGDASAWWANYTATRPVDYQVSWAEFRNCFTRPLHPSRHD
jgi:hypothetical protein